MRMRVGTGISRSEEVAGHVTGARSNGDGQCPQIQERTRHRGIMGKIVAARFVRGAVLHDSPECE